MKNDGLGASSTPHDDYNDKFCLDPDGDLEDATDVRGQLYFQPRVLNTLTRLLINKIPVDKLETFR